MRRGLATGLTVGLPISCGLWTLIIHIITRGLPVSDLHFYGFFALLLAAVAFSVWGLCK